MKTGDFLDLMVWLDDEPDKECKHVNPLHEELLAQQPWHVKATSIEADEHEEIPLRSLGGKPFYSLEGNRLSILDSIVPVSNELVVELGQRPVINEVGNQAAR